jgi:hypothetical protein
LTFGDSPSYIDRAALFLNKNLVFSHSQGHMTRNALLIPILFLAATGCEPAGPKVYPVKGKLTINGMPAKDVQLSFYPVASEGTVGSSVLSPDGSYEIISGNEGRPGIPQGKYKVVLQASQTLGKEAAMARYGGAGGAPPAAPEMSFPKEYAASDTSPKEVEVKAETNTINIDITK